MHTQHHAAGTSPIAYMLGLPAFHTTAEFRRGVRAQAEQQVDSLIALLDAMDGDPDLEPTLGFIADAADDECEPDADEEHTLGWINGINQASSGRFGSDLYRERWNDEREGDFADDEPSLAHPEDQPNPVREYFTGNIIDIHGGNQDRTSFGRSDDREEEHDGREPDESGYGDEEGLILEERGEYELGATEDFNHDLAWEPNSSIPWSVADGEPSLGWTPCEALGAYGNGDCRDDREEDAGDEGEMDDDREPSLGSLDRAINQGAWSMGNRGFVDAEEEHDGREREEGLKPFSTDRPVRLSDVASAVFVSLKASKTGVIAAWPR